MSLVNDIVTRLYLNSDWRDISSHVRAANGVVITRGRRAEDDTTPPQTCKFTLENTSGDYTERDPLGQWFGHLGRNTPVEVALRTVKDTATTAAASSWGSTDAHADGAWRVLAWTNSSGVASDFNKASGKATHLIGAANASRYSYLAAFSQRDLTMAVTLSLAVTNITGGAVGADFLIRGQSLAEYYAARVLIQTNESITLDIVDASGTSLTGGALTVPGLTHTSSQALRVRVQCEGQTVRAKIWAASQGEPYAWAKTFTDNGTTASTDGLIQAAGFVGIRSIVATGNTNVPITLSYDDVEVTLPEFAGEISEWPQARDDTGNERSVAIVASGLKRRRMQGETSSRSCPYQFHTNEHTNSDRLAAYWPLEEGSSGDSGRPAVTMANASVGPLQIDTLRSKSLWLGQGTLAPWLTPGVRINGSGGSTHAFLSMPDFTPADGWMVGHAFAGSASPPTYIYLTMQTPANRFAYVLQPELEEIDVYDTDGAVTTVSAGDLFDGELHYIKFTAYQAGADIEFALEVDEVVMHSATLSGVGSMTALEKITIEADGGAGTHSTGNAIGHLSAYDLVFDTSDNDAFESVFGFQGETAIRRATRLADEQSVAYAYIHSGSLDDDSQAMGPQAVQSLFDLLDECETVDGGLFYEQRSLIGVQFRSAYSIYSRTPWLTLNMASDHQFSGPWTQTADDRYINNDVTARRDNGGERHAELTTGRMSTADPADGGIGRYDSSVTLNTFTDDQLDDQASWRVHLGTVDEEVYPEIVVDLHRASVQADTALLAQLHDLDVGELIELEALTSNGIYDDPLALVLGYTKTLDRFRIRMELATVPGSPYRVLVFDAGNDTARLDSDYTTLGEDLDTTETGVTVTIATGRAFWTTTAGDYPFDLIVGGEVMTASACTAAAGQNQTFTVTRSANGVVKTHSTGAKISLARPNYIGL